MNASGERRARVWSKRLALGLGGALVACVLAELGVRAWLALDGHAWDAAAAAAEFHARIEASGRRVPAGLASAPVADDSRRAVIHPYFGRDTISRRSSLRRAAELEATPEGSAGFDVVVLGGTVASRLAAAEAPRLLALLAADPRLAGRTPRLWNEARDDFKQPQQAAALLNLLASGVEPELVILLDGPDDIALGLANVRDGSHPVYPAKSQWRAHVGRPVDDPERLAALSAWRRAERRIERAAVYWGGAVFSHSALLGSLRARRFAADDAAARDALARVDAAAANAVDDFVVRGPSVHGSADTLLHAIARAWYEGALTTAGVCREQGIAFVHVLLPLANPGVEAEPLGELEQERVREGYALERGALQRLVEHGVRVLDAERVLAGGGLAQLIDPLAASCLEALGAPDGTSGTGGAHGAAVADPQATLSR